MLDQSTVTISVVRPKHGISLFTCKMKQLMQFPVLKIFPDNKNKEESSFPGEGVTITSKPQGHLVIAYQHHEKWILSGFSSATVDIGSFSEHWSGCRIMVFSSKEIHGDF
jgi:hypothetical protein